MGKFFKIIFDFVLALVLLIVFSPLILLLLILSFISTSKFGFFVQNRVGKDAKIFKLYKIRSMITQKGDVVTVENDPRITEFGRFIRKYKLDELPQLINVLKGDMSFVGPRPDVPGYADKLHGDDRIILSVKPGITGPATIIFRNEEKLLAQQEYPVEYNDEVIWPKKVDINKKYIKNWSFIEDLNIIYKTIFA